MEIQEPRKPRACFTPTFALGLTIGVVSLQPLAGQTPGTVEGVVRSAVSSAAVAHARVVVDGAKVNEFTSPQGTFRLVLAPGNYRFRLRRVGFEPHEQTVRVRAGATTRVVVEMTPIPIALGGVEVSVLRPDLRPQTTLEQRDVREANPRDAGELLRVVPGVAAVRRGPVGLDPVVRGLRETEVGVYLDGTRLFPAGPARMDSPMSHFDPSAVRRMEVVTGPYALTWGAGNLGAIRVETQDVPPTAPGVVHGTVAAGYDANLDAQEVAGSVFGHATADVSYWAHGAWRQGDDYEDGAGTLVPGDFVSREGRAKVAVRLGDGHLTLAGGYQDQGAIDYPGRLLDAAFFETVSLSSRYELERAEGRLRSLDALIYLNNVDHGMHNDAKPTAFDAAVVGRPPAPPFALDVDVASAIDVSGGRVAVDLAVGPGTVEVGADLYRARREAVRTIARRASDFPAGPPAGTVLFEDNMWPDATILDVGAFVRGTRRWGRVTIAATARADVVRADAQDVSPFFSINAPTAEVEQSEFNLSGALTATAAVAPQWTVSAGLGSAVRTADAAERYSDRIPASKAQTSAEFMGNPALEPERSTQADLWLQGSFARASLRVNAFVRRIDDYITIAPTTLPKRLPLSPDIVFQYVNGAAEFFGFELATAIALHDRLTVGFDGGYLRGQDTALDEPALGITPWRGAVSLRYDGRGDRLFVDGSVRATARQTRVAATRGESPTEGYTTADLRGGVRIGRGVELRGGVVNVGDVRYVDHLNAKNPFTGQAVAEPGRVIFFDLTLAF